MIRPFKMNQVKINDEYFKNAFQKELEYLMSFDCDRLLAHFRATKGLEPKAECYGGWEDTEIRGHTMGHYLTALSQGYATTQSKKILDRLKYLLDELELCRHENGYLSAFPEEFLDRVENRQPIWVPWYTIHKIIAGLVSVYQLTGLVKARSLAEGLGDWVYNRTDKWTPEIHANVLSVEYGGMNDCLYELYKVTGNDKHRIAAHKFDEVELFKAIKEGKDILNNRHANTTIPKFLGALNRYFVYGDDEGFYLEACKQFWTMVVENHSYITGGNSEWEHFGEPNVLDAERTETNCETCNTYNMLKLTRGLFQITGEKKYADFYERTFINAILSSQNPETGMTTYFQPMATGFFKVYSLPFDHFWCCTGSGMENFTKLNDSIYFQENDNLYVNMYISSELDWTEKGLCVDVKSDLPNINEVIVSIKADKEVQAVLHFRIPDWAKGFNVETNDIEATYEDKNGYAVVGKVFKNNETIKLTFKTQPSISQLPDNSNVVAFTYGPVVLSAGLGIERLEESTTGVQVQIPCKHVEIKDYLVLRKDKIADWKANIINNLVKLGDKMEFILKGTDNDNSLVFTPHFAQHKERYGIYWKLIEDGSEELNKYIEEKKYADRVKAAEIDVIHVGNDQYELSHNISGQNTEAGDRDGFHFRVAKENGWFGYDIKICKSEENYLQLIYMPAGCQEGFDILINDVLITHESIDGLPWNRTRAKTFLIPSELIGDKDYVTVKFRATEKLSARIIDVIRTTKKV